MLRWSRAGPVLVSSWVPCLAHQCWRRLPGAIGLLLAARVAAWRSEIDWHHALETTTELRRRQKITVAAVEDIRYFMSVIVFASLPSCAGIGFSSQSVIGSALQSAAAALRSSPCSSASVELHSNFDYFLEAVSTDEARRATIVHLHRQTLHWGLQIALILLAALQLPRLSRDAQMDSMECDCRTLLLCKLLATGCGPACIQSLIQSLVWSYRMHQVLLKVIWWSHHVHWGVKWEQSLCLFA